MVFDYHSRRWRRVREKALKLAGYQCQESKRYGLARQATTVHHIWPAEQYPEYAYCLWNLLPLTRENHDAMHDRISRQLTPLGEYGVLSYSEPTCAGDAMDVNLDLKFAEGRLYAEGRLAEYMKLATGGTMSVAVKYIPKAAQIMMYDVKEKTRTVNGSAISSLSFTTKDIANYVGCSFYAPDKIDGVTKYTW